jgi:hypothetical protein
LKVVGLVSSQAQDWGIGLSEWHELPLAAAMISWQDVLFGAGVGVAGWLVLRVLAGRERISARMWQVFAALCFVFAVYGAASLGIFEYFGRPLNFDLLRFVQGLGAIRSSVTERLTPFALATILGAPAALSAVVVEEQGRRRIRTRTLALVAAVWACIGFVQARPSPDDWKSYRQAARSMALNPHVELAVSTLRACVTQKPSMSAQLDPQAVEEFRPFGARAQNALGAPAQRSAPAPRNVIVVTLESVGTKYLSLYGSRYATTPVLEREAAHALVFDNIYAHASQTICSFRSINFSIYPGLPWALAGWTELAVPPPLAQAMRERGGRTAYFHNGTLEWGGDRWMLDGRYETVEDCTDWNCPTLTSWGAEDRCTIDRLIRYLDECKGQQFLAYCWTDQTHDPYMPSEGMQMADFLQGQNPPPRHAKDLLRYLNVVHDVDRQLGRLFDALRERGLADETLVVITGDHGEAFADPHIQRGHGLTVYEEELRVPLILWNPRLFPEGGRQETIGGHVDLNPTIAELLGVPPNPGWQGHSLLQPDRPERALFMANVSSSFLFGVREAQWKYSYNATSGAEMLFDLETDPGEQVNCAAGEAARCKKLREKVAAWVGFEDAFLRAADGRIAK